jgi:hypothetical protein
LWTGSQYGSFLCFRLAANAERIPAGSEFATNPAVIDNEKTGLPMTKTDQKQIRISREGNWGSKLPFRLAAGAMALALTLPALAGQREQAKRMHDRLTGVPPTAAVLDRMEAEITAGKPTAAAMIAMDGPNNPNSKYFYNVTLKNFATPWTNEAQSVFEPLNDYSATIIGMVREGTGFDQLFSLDYVYAGVGTLPGVSASPSPISNAHYEQLEVAGIDLSDDTKFDQVSQVTAVGLPDASAAAGVFTTRAAARAFFIDGTNRAMFRFTMLNHLCKDMEQVKDTTRAADRIRQDVSRSPGGDSRIYMNACIGCHGCSGCRAAGLYARTGATEVPDQRRQLQVWLYHAG